MPDLALDLRFLRYAIVSAELGSFRRAAAVLDVPQSTISHRVKLLEHRLGTKLFERYRTGVRLTASGERFLQDAAAGALGIQRAAREMSADAKGSRETIRVGIITSLSAGFLKSD